MVVAWTEQDAKFYRDQFGLVLDDDQIIVAPEFLDGVVHDEPADVDALIERAVSYERRHKIALMRDVIQCDKHLGYGFMWGWNALPRSFAMEHVTLEKQISACMEMADFYEGLAKSHPPALVVCMGGGTGLVQKPVSLLCRDLGIPFRTLSPARTGDLYYWATDEFENSAELEACIRSFARVDRDSVTDLHARLEPPGAFTSNREAIIRGGVLYVALWRAARTVIHRLYARLRGYRRALYGTKPLSAVRANLVKYAQTRRTHRAPFRPIDELPRDRKLVFLPLQFEPEISLQGQSPERANILDVAHEVALSLPADALLVVKEHPLQLGRRPEEFYDRIAAMPNALLVRPLENSHALIQLSALVCAINSSVAYEAAMLGKPVAYFSHHGPIRAVPHVEQIAGFDDLGWIREVLARNDSIARQTREQDGARFYYALKAFCMDLKDLNLHARQEQPTEAELRLLADPLLASTPYLVKQAA